MPRINLDLTPTGKEIVDDLSKRLGKTQKAVLESAVIALEWMMDQEARGLRVAAIRFDPMAVEGPSVYSSEALRTVRKRPT